MGIQRFGAHLKSYATKSILGSTSSPVSTIAVIDGPGLAHHVYYKLCAKRDGSPEHITYSDIAVEVMKWLDTLTSIGYQVEAILFDGALPAAKKDVRIGRLQSYVDRVQAYKQSVGSSMPVLSGQSRRTLPPPPFLVFAIVEELLQHEEYASSTYVVPGEADGFCVAASIALSNDVPSDEVAIFSDDADLLVYRLPMRTCVVPFRDVFESRSAEQVTWTGEQYWSAEIVKQLPLGSHDLIEPAYYMAQDHHCDLKQACRKVAAADLTIDQKFAAFAKTFQPVDELAGWEKITKDSRLKSSLVVCDSRVSEVIYQLKQSDLNGGVRMYLPFLLEDVARATAWNVGADIRIMAYSALFQIYKTDAGVQEYRRSGSRVVSTGVDHLKGAPLDEQSTAFSTHLKMVKSWAAEDSLLDANETWRYLTMQQTLQYLHVERYPLPSLDDLVSVIMNMPVRKWHLIHLSAQYQAVYYSLRFLRQVLAHVSNISTGGPEAIPKEGLIAQLESLPRIATFFASVLPEDRAQVGQVWRERMSEVLEGFGGEQDLQMQGKKRKKKIKKARVEAPGDSTESGNPFAMLADV